MSFCRITGKAKGLPKPNYFPLLPPISPADAKRCCRITTKSQGLPGHHFIPALLGAKPPKSHCRVTAKSEGQAPHHFPDIEGALKPHELIPGYKYVFPSFDEEQKQQKMLLKLLSTKQPPGESQARYVYAVEEKSTGLVIPAELEAAVRDGDVRDVMLDKEGDTMLVKMLRGPNVTIDVTTIIIQEGDILWDGLGPSEAVLKQRRKEEKEAELRKKKRQAGLLGTKKIFEEKEAKADMEEIESAKREELKKSKMLKVRVRGIGEKMEEEVEMNGGLTPEIVSSEEPEGTVFGHIVQTATGVEFFPHTTTGDLPKGKVVPGRLIKSDEGVRFVPGIMSEGRFVPGQVVMTNTGDQFVPGQVVETSEGPKFVPGQVVDTNAGPKFVPGQTIETEDGPQFVPGQIIETKVGPTFIPGQIIFTDEKARFVPGRVVDTVEGPRFVPGRVIESGNQVTFVSGQVVETPDGLKFVAPDLEDDSDGGHEFSVQGFEVTPEELKLLRPSILSNPAAFGGDMSIDSRMLRQLSEAGMSLGRQVPAELPAVDIRSLPQVLERLKLEGVTAIKMGHVLCCLGQVAQKINNESDVCVTHIDVNEDMGSGLIHASEKQKDIAKYLKSIVASAVASLSKEDEISEETAMVAIASAIDRALGEWADNIPMNGVVEYLHNYLTKPINISNVAIGAVQHLQESETVKDKLQFALRIESNPLKAAEKLAVILKDSMGDAFQKISAGHPDIVLDVLKRLKESDMAESEQQATEQVQNAIVNAVRAKSGQALHNLLLSKEAIEDKEFKDLLLQSIGLARALGMPSVAAVLLEVVNDTRSHEVLAKDPTTMDILERLTVMRQFAEMKPELGSALRQLVSDPELARSDPGVRELVRHSTALMVVPEECVQTSEDIPASLLMADNALVMEEFLVRNRRPRTLLIIKRGMQAVIPRDMARAVITGQVPYAVLDEKGIKYFEPMHLFSTMKLPQYAAHCFSMYVCPEVDNDSGLATPAYSSPRGSVSSGEDLSFRKKHDWSRRSSHYAPDRHSRRGTVQINHPTTKHILDRRLSDWANGTLFINNGTLCRSGLDSLGCDNNGSVSYSNSDEDSFSAPRLDCLNYKLRQVQDLYIVTKDFHADDDISLSLRMGELVTVLDHGDSWSKRLRLDIDEGSGLLDTSTARYKLSVRPRRKHADSRQRAVSPFGPDQARWLVRTASGPPQSGWVPAIILQPQSEHEDEEEQRPEDAKFKREAVVRELVETEEEFGRDLLTVVDHYMRPLDSSHTPRVVRDNIDLIFSNFKQIANFHNTVLIEGVKYYANEPRMLGKTFLRLERDFDKHVTYCRDEPIAQEFLLDNPTARDFFEDLSQRIGDDKSLSEHLKLPIQRIHDYQLLLKELVKYSCRLSENTDDLQRALDLMLAVPHRANDNKFISNIEGYHGNIHKLGRLLRHDWFTYTDNEQKSKERYLFLFKARILICKVKRISEDRSVFVLQEIVRLPEVEVKDCEQLTTFELIHKDPNLTHFPITVSAHLPEVKNNWLKEIRKYASDALALQEHAADDLRIQADDSQVRKEPTAPGNQLKAQLEAKLSKVAKRLETEETHDIVQETIKSQELSHSQAKVARLSTEESVKSSIVTKEAAAPVSQPESKKAPESAKPPDRVISPELPKSKPQEQPKVQEPVKAPEPVKVQEPVKAPEPVKAQEPVKAPEPIKVQEPVKAPEPIKVQEPVKAPEPVKVQEPAKTPEPIKVQEPVKAPEPAKVQEPAKAPEPVKAPEPFKVQEPVKAPEPIKVQEPVKAPEPVKVQEPVKAPEPIKVQEPVKVKEPVKVPEPAKAPEPVTIQEPVKAPEPIKVQEPVKAPEPVKVQEPVKAPEPAKVQEPAKAPEPVKVQEPAKAHEPVKVQEPVKAPETAKVQEPALSKAPEPIKVQETAKAPEKPQIVEQSKREELVKVVEQKKPQEPVKVPDSVKLTEPTKVTTPEQSKTEPAKPAEKPKAPEPSKPTEAPKAQEPIKTPEQPKPVEQTKAKSSSDASAKSEPPKTQSQPPSSTQIAKEEPTQTSAVKSEIKETAKTVAKVETTTGSSVKSETDQKDMSQRSSKTVASKVVEESYSMSSTHEEVRMESSSFSSSSIQQTSSSSYQTSSSSALQSSTAGAITSGGSHVTITEVGRPVFARTISGHTKRPGESAIFECQLNSEAHVTWLKDNKALEDKLADRVTKSSTDDHSYRLEIIHLSERDSGIYTALAKNAEGSSTCTAQLLVRDMTDEEKARLAAANAPEFSIRLKDTELLTNTNFRFMVKVSGNPKPELKFFKDGQPISTEGGRAVVVTDQAEKGFYELVIADVQNEDKGKYSCVAKNKFGETTCEGRVTVTDSKKVFEGLESAELLQPGEKAAFSWLRDGKPFDPEERFKVLLGNEEDSLALVFQHVKPEDAGLYTCVASTSTGRISCSAELSVMGTINQLSREPEKPKLSTECRVSETSIGGTAVLEAKILGFPKPDVRWFHDGNEVKPSGRLKFLFEDQESMTLVIKNVTSEDAGVYKIVAKNDLGEDSTELQLTVKAAPKFKRKFTETNCMQGEVLKLTTEIEGCPTPDVKWFRDGKEIVQSDRIKCIKEGNIYSLLIGNCELTDTASYSVVATNEVNQSSDFVHVKVRSSPKFLKKLEPKLEVSESTKLVFSVSATADPPPTVKWLKNGNEIKSDDTKYKISSDAASLTLIVYDAKRDDSADYSVELRNEYGTNTDTCHVDVKCGPIFKTNLKDTVAHEGVSDVELHINVNAYPKPTVRWFFEDMEITEKKNEFVKIEEGSDFKLIIKEATLGVEGKYSVKVSNDLGTSEDTCKLTVNCKPRFNKPLPPKTEVDEGAELTLQVECHGCPEPEIKWFKDGKEVHADAHIKITKDSHRSESYSMTLNLVKASDTGEYEVKASNTMGTVSTKTQVHVYTKTTETSSETREEVITQEVTEEEIKPVVEKVKEKTKSATQEGTQDAHSIVETTRTHVHITESDSPEFGVEEIGSFVLQEKTSFSFSAGIVEEFSDGEGLTDARSQRLSLSRGVSIVSVSEDERTLSRTSSVNDLRNEPNTKCDAEGNIVIKRESSLKESELEDELTLEVESKQENENLEDAHKQSPLDKRKKSLKEIDTGEVSFIENKLEQRKQSIISDVILPNLANAQLNGDDVDSDLDSLLNRVQKQRSVLQEILQKEQSLSNSVSSSGEESSGEMDDPDISPISKTVNKSSSMLPNNLKTTVDEQEITLNDESKPPINNVASNDEKSLFNENNSDNEFEDKLGNERENSNVNGSNSDDTLIQDKVTGTPQDAGKQSPFLSTIKSQKADTEQGKSEAFPVISNHDLVERNVFESLSTSYSVQATGIPRPEATWYRDGTQFTASDRVIISDEGETYRIEIKDLTMADAGIYKCNIKNRLGEVSKEAKLELTSVNAYRKPVFKVPLADLKVPKTQPAVLTCVIVGDPVPDVTWLHNGKEVNIDDMNAIANMDLKEIENNLFECSYSLALPRALHKDTGIYTIMAKNQYGHDESSARLDVVLKPEISNLRDITAIPYESAELSATVHSNPACSIAWLDKAGSLVKGSEHRVLSEDRENEVFKVSFSNIGLGDAGYYTLVAKNELGDAQQQVHFTVHTEMPTVVKNLDDKRISDYADVDFHIRFNGVPKVQVKWMKNGEEILSSDRILIETSEEGQVSSSLYIKHFCVKDIGQYSVIGSNLVGSAESTAQLRMVQMPPTFGRMLPRLEEIAETETLDLRCKLDGSPVPTVAWFKDGEPLVADHHVQLTAGPDGSIRLLIENVKPTDCGAYKLVAENQNGSTAAICAVAVKPKPCKPILLRNLENAKEIVGEPLKLEAQIMAYPAPEVKWFKDGQPIRPTQAINFINQPGGVIGLVLDALRPEDAGQYEVRVSNRLGEVTGEATVEVQAREKRPTFDAHLMPVSVVEGFPAKLEVKVAGHPKPVIKWRHKGKDVVPDGQHIKLIEQPDGTTALLIDKATALDAGEWAAVAINDKGEVSSKADLLVTEKGIAGEPESRPAFISPLRALSVEEGAPLIISAPFIGNPIPDVSWTKNGVPVKPDERILLTCDGKKVGLEIKPSVVGDTGTYACRLVSPLGESTSEADAVVRKIFHPPSFSQKFSDLQQLPTYVAKFPARVVGAPRPDIEWFFGDRPIHESEKYHMKRDGDAVCLYIRDCEPGDTGRYRCRATNKEGSEECEANLEVVREIEKKQKSEAPYFLKKLGDCETFKGMTARFTACATGHPEPEAEWFKGEVKLYANDRVRMDRELNGLLRLSIAGVDIGDVGRYRLQVTNPHGHASCEADLRFDDLEVRPRRPLADQYADYDRYRASGVPLPLADRPIISRMTDRHLTLSWKPSIPHGPRIPVTYRVEMAEQPDGEWFAARSGVRSCACDIRNLEPFRDYKFRIRVENKYGVSDPSPFAVTYRQKLEPDPPKFVPFLSPGIDFRPETSPYFPKDFDIEKPPHDGYSQAPRFLLQEHDTQYGVKNHNSNLFWFVYGYPKPKVTYLFNDEPIEMGGRYDSSYTRNGQATLFINRMLERDVGIYEAIASNEHGEARQRVRMDIAEYPVFIERPEETLVMLRKSGRITARVTGVPYPDIKWYKDWQPLAPSSRIKIQQIPPDTVVLIINDAINKDEGLYSVSARNVAGAVSSSAMVHIEESEQEYAYMTYGRGRNVKPKTKPLTDFYDLGDELGRGTQGVTYHAVERLSGRNYAAKMMHGRSELRAYMNNELDILNVLNHRKLIRLQDSFETRDQLVLVLELAGGGELLGSLTSQTFTTETEIAGYIRQILWGLEYLHSQDIAHLGLTLNDLLLSHPGGDDLKICDFGLSRRIAYGKLATLDYGMPEFVSPEIANGEGVSYPADLWSVGIITYILLSGISPFKGQNDRETLTKIREGKWEFFEERFCNISMEARDFITKLLVYQAEGRLDVRNALRHPWLSMADKIPVDQFSITTDSLKTYYDSLRDWYNNASCRTWYRRRPLSGAFSHPSRMVYPPGHRYTPEPEDTRAEREPREPKTWEQTIPSRDPLDYEVGDFKSESHYQYGPDTYLLQLRDVDLPCRLRRYMKIAANRGVGASLDIQDHHIDIRTPVIRERRRFTDVMDEEIDDERKARINKYGSTEVYSLRRLRHELGLRSDGHAEAEALLEFKRDGHVPFFREKPQMLAIIDDQPAQLSCLAVGDPKPNVQWFKNDLVIVESNRVKMIEDEEGRSILQFLPALHVDVGIYKAVARNRVSQTVARTRIVVAAAPDSPDSPEAAEVSDQEILLRWKQPKDDGHSPVLCYSLQYKQADNVEWITLASNIDHEFWLVKELKPLTNYVFRLSARNCIGWSENGIPTALVKTLEPGSPPIVMSRAMRHLQSHTESSGEIYGEEHRPKLNYSIENRPIDVSTESNIAEKYSFVSELSRGEFSVVVKGIEKSTDEYVVAKLLEVNAESEEAVAREFDNLRSLQHERIVTLFAAIRPAPSVAVLVMEKLQGADILSYFTSRHEYTEQMVATVITQVLDGLQYLHWRGLCHLNVQPDNIVLSSVRALQIKLVDFGAARQVSKLGNIVNAPSTDYTAPEVLAGEPAYPQSDIWSLGTLTYVLLSGVSPFRGATPDETRQNIVFVRYRFEHLYKELTQEATRFVMLLFKRTPSKRPTVEECYEHRWLLPTDFMIKKRERAVFLGNRLKEYSDLYHGEKMERAIRTEALTNSFGSRGPLVRSNSIQEELTTTF